MLEVFAFLILALWLVRNTLRNRRNEDRIAQLTSRIYALEQQVEAARNAPEPSGDLSTPVAEPERELWPPPAPPPVVVPPPPAEVEPPLPEPEPVAAIPEARPRARLLNLEETLGTNWLNKLGVVILVIGIALFLVYELRELGPPGKITVGYLVSAAMLAAGIYFERREQWRVLA